MKKGFTLVEIIITIGLIAIIGTVIVTNMSGTLNAQKEERYENFKKVLEDAACTYIDLNKNSSLKNTCKLSGSCTVLVSALLNEGLIEDGDLHDPKKDETISGSTIINITYTNGVKTCTYNE